MRKLQDIVLYQENEYYAAFPSIVSRPDGELLVAFRRAPDRRRFFAPGCTHTDPNSYLVLVRSSDLGQTWSPNPELIYAHPFGGSQDPCMVQLDDGTLVVTSYAWMLLPRDALTKAAPQDVAKTGDIAGYGWAVTFLGGYLVRSTDNGRSWDGPLYAPQIEDQEPGMCGLPQPAMNRGAMVQARDGNLYWAVATARSGDLEHTRLDLMVSEDRGLNWQHRGVLAGDERVVFNETSLVETAGGDLVAFVRTAEFEDHTVVVRSQDLGESWEPWEDSGIVGHPHHALRLPDDRIFLVYGYRHEPFGIRARVLDPDCRSFDAPELVLRDDGGSGDLGYPWSCLTKDGRVLAVYYFSQADGARHIAGTFLEIG